MIPSEENRCTGRTDRPSAIPASREDRLPGIPPPLSAGWPPEEWLVALLAEVGKDLRYRGLPNDLVDELVQQVAVRLLRRRFSKQVDDPRAFARMVARHATIDAFRARARQPEARASGLDVAALDARLAEMERQERRRLIDAALQRLPEKQRRVVVLHFFEGETLSQIAAGLGQDRSSVREMLKRALARLREMLTSARGELL